MPSLPKKMENRELTELTTTDFNTALAKNMNELVGSIDITKGVSSSSNKKALQQGFTSALSNTGPGIGKDLGDAALGIFRTDVEVLCPASSNKSTRSGRNNRKLGSGNRQAGCVPTEDELLNIDNSIDDAISKQTDSISDKLLADYEEGLKSSSKRTSIALAGTSVVVSEQDIVRDGIKELSKQIGPVGATIANKIDVRTMLGCPGGATKNSSRLDKSALKTSLKNTKCAVINEVVSVLGTLINKIEVFPSDDILDIYTDSLVSGEIGSVNGVIGLGQVAASNGIRLDTKNPNVASKLLGKLATVTTVNDSADIDGVTSTLSTTSPGWNTDKDGNPDHSVVSGNKFINQGVTNKVRATNTYGGNVVTIAPVSTPEEKENYMMLLASSW